MDSTAATIKLMYLYSILLLHDKLQATCSMRCSFLLGLSLCKLLASPSYDRLLHIVCHHTSCPHCTCRINGLTHINLTKLDCLDALDTIKLGVEYRIDGAPTASPPADLSRLEAVDVKYLEIPGWKSDISKCRLWSDLPDNAKKYIAVIEDLVGVKCKWIGVGPGRDAIVVQP